MARFVFDWFLCLFVCFFVSKITRKQLDWFAWNFQGRCGVTTGRPDYIFGQFRETVRCAPQLVNVLIDWSIDWISIYNPWLENTAVLYLSHVTKIVKWRHLVLDARDHGPRQLYSRWNSHRTTWCQSLLTSEWRAGQKTQAPCHEVKLTENQSKHKQQAVTGYLTIRQHSTHTHILPVNSDSPTLSYTQQKRKKETGDARNLAVQGKILIVIFVLFKTSMHTKIQ